MHNFASEYNYYNHTNVYLVVIRFFSKFRFMIIQICLHSFYELFLFRKIHKMLQNQGHQTSAHISYRNQIRSPSDRVILTVLHAKELSNFCQS
jgi:hypothetical protein